MFAQGTRAGLDADRATPLLVVSLLKQKALTLKSQQFWGRSGKYSCLKGLIHVAVSHEIPPYNTHRVPRADGKHATDAKSLFQTTSCIIPGTESPV